MKRNMLILAALFAFAAQSLAVDYSDDGRQSADVTDAPGRAIITTDVVPFPEQPDYTCNLRMQVGGLDFGDFDNDGDPDLAVGCYHSQSYPPYDDWRNFVLVNNDGQLETEPSWWSSDQRSTTDVKWADFNGDTYLDLFAANGDFSFDPNVIYFGSADGLSTTPGWLVDDNTWTLYVAPADFDNDGDIDVATANEGVSPLPYRHIYIYKNDGSGLQLFPWWQSGDTMIANFLDWGDMDGDGWLDLAASKWANFESGVYGNNYGNISSFPIWTSGSTRSDKGIGWADVDGDSFPELAIGATEPTWLFDNVEGELQDVPMWQSNNSYHGCQDLKWADVDGDGDPDLATVHFSTGHLRIYLNIDGVLESTPSWEYDAASVGTAIAFADINGDDALDLVMGVSGQPSVMVFLNTGQTGIHDRPTQPELFSLNQNYPNPFNSSTRIEFVMPQAGRVRLDVYDLLGRRIVTLVDGNRDAGEHSVTWDATEVSSGVYFYRLTAGDRSETRRMTLLK